MLYWWQYIRTLKIIYWKRFRNIIALKKGRHYQKFIILCTGRTGSTYLHTCLNSHPNVCSFGDTGLGWGEQLIKTKWKPYARHIHAIGMKVFYEPGDQEVFSEMKLPDDVRVIHLTRKDELAMYYSRLKAEATGLWTGPSDRGPKITIQDQEFLHFKNAYLTTVAANQQQLSDYKVLDITYESLTEDTEKSLNQIQKFLGVRPKKLFSLLPKQRDYPLEEGIENYGDLRVM